MGIPGVEDEGTSETERRTLLFMEHMRHSAGESDRGLVLFLAAQLDSYLREILEAFLIHDNSVRELFDGPYAPFASLSGKTKAAFVLGLVTSEEADCIDAVRKVRNVFAHEIDASFDHDKVKRLCQKPPIFDGRLCDRDAFLHMGLNAAPPLLYRKLLVERKWRRSELTRQDVQHLDD
jgi:hypothetical protein